MMACLNSPTIQTEDKESDCHAMLLVKYLVEVFGADPLYRSITGTPLICAIDIINFHTVKYLIDGKPKVYANHQDSNGLTAFYYSVYRGDPPIFKLLHENGGDPFIRGTK